MFVINTKLCFVTTMRYGAEKVYYFIFLKGFKFFIKSSVLVFSKESTQSGASRCEEKSDDFHCSCYQWTCID